MAGLDSHAAGAGAGEPGAPNLWPVIKAINEHPLHDPHVDPRVSMSPHHHLTDADEGAGAKASRQSTARIKDLRLACQGSGRGPTAEEFNRMRGDGGAKKRPDQMALPGVDYTQVLKRVGADHPDALADGNRKALVRHAWDAVAEHNQSRAPGAADAAAAAADAAADAHL